jgi:uncharacterized protein YcbK (DUF882 family)
MDEWKITRKDGMVKSKLFRRKIEAAIMGILCFGLILMTSLPGMCETENERQLSFYNTHTRENVTVIYKRGEEYIERSLEQIDYICRDHRANKVHEIDPRLLDYLYDLLTEVGNHGEVHIISGYRSPATNAKLRNKCKGVAKRSLHMEGKALDFRLPGTDTAVLRDVALSMRRGGVGYYKKSDFVQIDTGRVRCW